MKAFYRIFQVDISRTNNDNEVYLNSGGEGNILYLRYLDFTWSKPTAGDIATFNIRFNVGYKNINTTLTNVGDGTWKVERYWLVEKK